MWYLHRAILREPIEGKSVNESGNRDCSFIDNALSNKSFPMPSFVFFPSTITIFLLSQILFKFSNLCLLNYAFESLEKIEESIKKNVSKDTLMLAALGPTATILASDMCLIMVIRWLI